MPKRTLSLGLSTLLGITSGFLPGTISAQTDDYSATSHGWNGLASLVDLAAESGVPLVVEAEIDLNRLSANDALFIVYPTDDLPIRDLGAFMTAGGRLTLADDFGMGEDLLASYGIERTVPRGTGEITLRGNDSLLVAESDMGASHVLTEGVTALVTNHPAMVRHEALSPLIAFHGTSGGLLLAGRVGAGRLIVLSDPSVLINNMLELDDNRRFATNLLRYLYAARGGKVYLVTQRTRIVGAFGTSDHAASTVRRYLAAFASADAPPLALRLGAVVLAAILLAVAITSLPRRSPYEASAMLPVPGGAGTRWPKDVFFRAPGHERFDTALAYRFELERALLARLELPEGSLLRDVVSALRSRGVAETTLEEVRSFLLELEALEQQKDLPRGTTQLSERRFHAMIERGERILAAVSRENEPS